MHNSRSFDVDSCEVSEDDDSSDDNKIIEAAQKKISNVDDRTIMRLQTESKTHM